MFVWLIAAASITAVDAERALTHDAQRIGQWTAFRKYADETAVMFNPQAVWAHQFLASLKNPPQALIRGPLESWVSCDQSRRLDLAGGKRRLLYHGLGPPSQRVAVGV
jgi:hypothetical protein